MIERVHEDALAAARRGGRPRKKPAAAWPTSWSPRLTARLKQFIASFEGSPHVEELFSEHLMQARDLYQKYAALYAAQSAATIERVRRRQRLALHGRHDAATNLRAASKWRSTAPNPRIRAMQPAAAFLARPRHHGADADRRRRHGRRRGRDEVALAKKSARRKPGDRK